MAPESDNPDEPFEPDKPRFVKVQRADDVFGRSDLPSEPSETAALSLSSRLLRKQAEGGPGGTTTLKGGREILFVIRGVIERGMISEDHPFVLGRADIGSRFHPDLDLTPYGALDRGVSRSHAILHLEGDNLMVADQNSTNGSFLRGDRLTPNEPVMLQNGDELLGRLAIQVLFK